MEDESEDECVARKIPELVAEGLDQDQAVGAAFGICRNLCSEKSVRTPSPNRAEKRRERKRSRRAVRQREDVIVFKKLEFIETRQQLLLAIKQIEIVVSKYKKLLSSDKYEK